MPVFDWTNDRVELYDQTEITDPSGHGPAPFRDPNGRLWAVFSARGIYEDDWLVGYSDDNGASWTIEVVKSGGNQNGVRVVYGLEWDDDNGRLIVCVGVDNGSGADEYISIRARTGDDTYTELSQIPTDQATAPANPGPGGMFRKFGTNWFMVYRSFISPNIGWEGIYRITTDLTSTGPEGSIEAGERLDSIHSSRGNLLINPVTDEIFISGWSFFGGAAGTQSNRHYSWTGSAWTRRTNNMITKSNGSSAAICSIWDQSGDYIHHFISANDIEYWRYDPDDDSVVQQSDIYGAGIGSFNTGYMAVSVSGDGNIHFFFGFGTQVLYTRSTDNGDSWSTVEEVIPASFFSGGGAYMRIAAFWHQTLEGGQPIAGVALIVQGNGSTNQGIYYIASSDIEWPAVASGKRVTRLAMRTVGPVPPVISPLTLPTDLPPFLRPDWEPGIEIANNFQSDITKSVDTGAEDRRSLTERPTRTQTVQLMGMSRHESWLIHSLINRLLDGPTVIPLYSDASRITASSSGTIVFADTRYRRFFKGARVIVWKWGSNGLPDAAEIATISNVVADRLIVSSSMSGTFPAGSRVAPLMDVLPELASEVTRLSDQHLAFTLKTTEVTGFSSLPSLLVGDPPEFATYNGYPIFHFAPNWIDNVRLGGLREGKSTLSGRKLLRTLYEGRPRATHDVVYGFLSRAVGWQAIRFFESRKGRVRPFWVTGAASLWEPAAIATTYVDIEPAGDIDDIDDFVDYVCVLMRDGTVYIRGLDSIAVQGDYWRMTFDTSIDSVSLGDVRRVTSAQLSRLDSDEFKELWATDETLFIGVRVVELLSEADVSIS